MWILTCWLIIMGAGGLCYPRRPRLSGLLFLAAGVFMSAIWAAGLTPGLPLPAATSAVLGLGTIWRFRSPLVRAQHRAEWVGKC